MDDPRQKEFQRALGTIYETLSKEGYENENIVANNAPNMFRASHVNVGWIKDAVIRKWKKELILIKKNRSLRMEEVKEEPEPDNQCPKCEGTGIIEGEAKIEKEIMEFVFSCVQRGKRCEVKINEKYINVKLVTKDDFGYYDYGFYVYIGE